jgi:GTP-binding protein
VIFEDQSRLLIADIPGIIENAHQDRGLGLAFLRHIERCSILVFVIELFPWDESRDSYAEFCMLRKELESYNPELLKKPFLVALNKTDIEDTACLIDRFREQYSFPQDTLFAISAQTGSGCDELKRAIHALAPGSQKIIDNFIQNT